MTWIRLTRGANLRSRPLGTKM